MEITEQEVSSAFRAAAVKDEELMAMESQIDAMKVRRSKSLILGNN